MKVFVDRAETEDFTLYSAVKPRRYYLPMRPALAVWFGILKGWWYLEWSGTVVSLEEPPPAGTQVTAVYEFQL